MELKCLRLANEFEYYLFYDLINCLKLLVV